MIQIEKLIEWTTSTIRYYVRHRASENDQKTYLDEIIKFCEKEKENL